MRNRDLIGFTLQYLYRQFSVYIHHLLYWNYYISYCLCAAIVQLIPQVHYIKNATSQNNNSHAMHTILIYIEHSCKWNEISDRELTRNTDI